MSPSIPRYYLFHEVKRLFTVDITCGFYVKELLGLIFIEPNRLIRESFISQSDGLLSQL